MPADVTLPDMVDNAHLLEPDPTQPTAAAPKRCSPAVQRRSVLYCALVALFVPTAVLLTLGNQQSVSLNPDLMVTEYIFIGGDGVPASCGLPSQANASISYDCQPGYQESQSLLVCGLNPLQTHALQIFNVTVDINCTITSPPTQLYESGECYISEPTNSTEVATLPVCVSRPTNRQHHR